MKMIDNISQLYIKGFIRAIDNSLLKMAKESRNSSARSHIECNYLNQFFQEYRLIRSGSWEGIDDQSKDWHNDRKEGHNISFLIYLDKCSPESGGQLEVKTNDFKSIIYPEPGLVVILNQSMHFKHRALPCKTRRRVLSFDYLLNDLETKWV